MESPDFFTNQTTFNSFKGKNIIVTGATGGIGSVVVENLVQLGANVTAISRSEKKVLDKLSKVAKKENFGYEIINFELPTSINRGFTNIMNKYGGKLDCLIICHAVFVVGKLMDTVSVQFDTTLNVNVRSCFHLISMASVFLKLTKGNITVLSSLESFIPVSESFLNSVSKVFF